MAYKALHDLAPDNYPFPLCQACLSTTRTSQLLPQGLCTAVPSTGPRDKHRTQALTSQVFAPVSPQ